MRYIQVKDKIQNYLLNNNIKHNAVTSSYYYTVLLVSTVVDGLFNTRINKKCTLTLNSSKPPLSLLSDIIISQVKYKLYSMHQLLLIDLNPIM